MLFYDAKGGDGAHLCLVLAALGTGRERLEGQPSCCRPFTDANDPSHDLVLVGLVRDYSASVTEMDEAASQRKRGQQNVGKRCVGRDGWDVGDYRHMGGGQGR